MDARVGISMRQLHATTTYFRMTVQLVRDSKERSCGDDAVMPDYTFSCEGEVKQWIVQWYLVVSELSDSCEIVLDFNVLRPTGSCSVTSIGKNPIAVMTGVVREDINVISTFNISASERIQVREGDMVGLAVTYNKNICDQLTAGPEEALSTCVCVILEQDEGRKAINQAIMWRWQCPDSILVVFVFYSASLRPNPPPFWLH